MATHSSVLAWRIPGTVEPGGLLAVYGVPQSQTWLKWLSSSSSVSLGWRIIGFISSLFDFLELIIPFWRRHWQPIPVLLPGKSHGRRSQVGYRSMGSQRVGHNWATSLSLFIFIFIHWRRTWQPTPVFLHGESQGWQSLVGCHLWGRTESDTTKVT